MSIGEDLRTFIIEDAGVLALLANAADWGIVEQNNISEDAPQPRIWFTRSGDETELDQDGTSGLVHSRFDLEVMALDIDVALDLTAVIKTALHGYRGTFGSGFALGIFVEDHDDDYLYRGLDADEGLNVSALRILIQY